MKIIILSEIMFEKTLLKSIIITMLFRKEMMNDREL